MEVTCEHHLLVLQASIVSVYGIPFNWSRSRLKPPREQIHRTVTESTDGGIMTEDITQAHAQVLQNDRHPRIELQLQFR
jgi:hypothetical protein